MPLLSCAASSVSPSVLFEFLSTARRGAFRRSLAAIAGVLLVSGVFAPAAWATAATTTTTLTNTPTATSPQGTVFTLTATVTSGGVPVTAGRVKFCDNVNPVSCSDVHYYGSAQLNSQGKAVIKIKPGSYYHYAEAVFQPTTAYATSTSSLVVLYTTAQNATTTTLTFTGSAGNYSLNATVIGSGTSAQLNRQWRGILPGYRGVAGQQRHSDRAGMPVWYFSLRGDHRNGRQLSVCADCSRLHWRRHCRPGGGEQWRQYDFYRDRQHHAHIDCDVERRRSRGQRNPQHHSFLSVGHLQLRRQHQRRFRLDRAGSCYNGAAERLARQQPFGPIRYADRARHACAGSCRDRHGIVLQRQHIAADGHDGQWSGPPIRPVR